MQEAGVHADAVQPSERLPAPTTELPGAEDSGALQDMWPLAAETENLSIPLTVARACMGSGKGRWRGREGGGEHLLACSKAEENSARELDLGQTLGKQKCRSFEMRE